MMRRVMTAAQQDRQTVVWAVTTQVKAAIATPTAVMLVTMAAVLEPRNLQAVVRSL